MFRVSGGGLGSSGLQYDFSVPVLKTKCAKAALINKVRAIFFIFAVFLQCAKPLLLPFILSYIPTPEPNPSFAYAAATRVAIAARAATAAVIATLGAARAVAADRMPDGPSWITMSKADWSPTNPCTPM